MAGAQKHRQQHQLTQAMESGRDRFIDGGEGAAFVSGFQLDTRRGPLLMLGGYCYEGQTEEVFKKVARETAFGKRAFILAADFNRSPAEIEQLPWISRLGASILHTGEATCKSREGTVSEIDFLVVSDSILDDVSVKAFWEVPWGTHAGLEIVIDEKLSSWRTLVSTSRARLPKPIKKPEVYGDEKPSPDKSDKWWRTVRH